MIGHRSCIMETTRFDVRLTQNSVAMSPRTGYLICYEVKYTTRNPSQLPITPIAEYELVNIRGRNSYFFPKTSS